MSSPEQPVSWCLGPAPTVRDAIIEGTGLLHAAGIDSARLDAEVLLRHVLQLDRGQLYVNLGATIDRHAESRFGELLARRLRREPVAYITGHREFWSLDFRVTRDVLIPRPETERLVEIAIEIAGGFGAREPRRILDLGTGSGAIAVSLATALPAAQLWAADASWAALAVARWNASRHGIAHRIAFIASDLFDSLGVRSAFHLIVANPPYVRRDEIDSLAPEVAWWEPRHALDGGPDGLEFYRRIAAGAACRLAPEGMLLMEIAAEAAQQVVRLLQDSASFTGAAIHRDYTGRERVIVARKTAVIAARGESADG